jgi:ribosomal protein S18 acetylase RimI-like enzyme
MPVVEARRITDPAYIERVLQADAFDVPIPLFPDRLLKHAVRTYLAPSDRVFFIVGEVDGQYAGFVFAHALGVDIWRVFARRALVRHPFEVARVAARIKARGWWSRLRPHSGERTSTPAAVPGIQALGRPFAWSKEPGLAQVDQLFVKREFRGLRLGAIMLRTANVHMAEAGAVLAEAHVDAGNDASVKAFAGAGWDVFRADAGDYYARWTP